MSDPVYVGTEVTITMPFVNRKTSLAADPPAVYLEYLRPGGSSWTILQYGVDSEIIRDGEGDYRGVILADAAGLWPFYIVTTGGGNIVGYTYVSVRPRPGYNPPAQP